MSRFDSPFWWPTTVVVAAAIAPAQMVVAASYLSVAGAQRALFPAARSFEPLRLAPTADEIAAAEAAAGEPIEHGELALWAARDGEKLLGYVFVDNVIGREDYITYAVGIDSHGALLPVEILDYRESHGGEIRNKRWLAQFSGHSSLEEIEFRTDIKNIAGATLSSAHVTAGVRRILALWQTVVRPATER